MSEGKQGEAVPHYTQFFWIFILFLIGFLCVYVCV